MWSEYHKGYQYFIDILKIKDLYQVISDSKYKTSIKINNFDRDFDVFNQLTQINFFGKDLYYEMSTKMNIIWKVVRYPSFEVDWDHSSVFWFKGVINIGIPISLSDWYWGSIFEGICHSHDESKLFRLEVYPKFLILKIDKQAFKIKYHETNSMSELCSHIANFI